MTRSPGSLCSSGQPPLFGQFPDQSKVLFPEVQGRFGAICFPPFPLDFEFYHLMVTAASLLSSKMPMTDSSLLVVSSRAPHLLALADIRVKNLSQGTPEIWTASKVIALSGEAWGIYRLPEEPKLCMQF